MNGWHTDLVLFGLPIFKNRHAFEIMRLRRVEVEKNTEIWDIVFNRPSRDVTAVNVW